MVDMADIAKGSFCKSISGHDKDTVYIIVDNRDALYVADGRIKKLGNPKKKNPKHLEQLEYSDESLNRKIAENKLRDEDIKYSIKNYLINIKN